MTDIRTWAILENGDVEVLSIHALTLDEVSLQLPAGVYTTFRTYERTKVLDLGAHFKRLEESAEFLGHPVSLNQEQLRRAIRIVLLGLSKNEYRFRVSVGFKDDIQQIFVSVELLHLLPKSSYENGVNVVLSDIHRETPKAKSTTFIQQANAARSNLRGRLNEALMVDERGIILEGLSSNFFAVRSGVVFTADEGILEGITRSLAIASAKALQLEVRFSGVHVSDLIHLDECFITSTSRGVLPVVNVGNIQIGNEKPGQITRAIAEYFKLLIVSKLEEI